MLTVLVHDDEGRAKELVLRRLLALCYAGVENLVEFLHSEVLGYVGGDALCC